MRRFVLLLLLAACPPAQQWRWVDVDGSRCANGARTGVAFDEGSSDELVVYVAGGGACWDAASCYGAKLAWNIDFGYGPTQFNTEPFRFAAVLDRTSPDNPFPDASYAFIPYCTGDLHSGTATRNHLPGITTHHVGRENLDVLVARIKEEFGSSKRVFIVGTSAGGYGVQLNAKRLKDAFAPRPVHLLADSAPSLEPRAQRWPDWSTSWGAELPATGWTPQSDIALLTSERDWTLTSFLGYPGDEFKDAVHALPMRDKFIAAGDRHVFLTGDRNVTSTGGQTLGEWLKAWADSRRK